MLRVRVHSRRAVEDGAAEGADAIVSIRLSAATSAPDLDAAIMQSVQGDVDAVLRLRFDDIAVPSYGPYVGPTMEHVADVLDFGRRVRAAVPDGLIVAHCEHGVSRSAAVALALLADDLGPGLEGEAVQALLRQDIEGRMHPNPSIVGMTDAALFRFGRIDAALTAASPRYVKWCDHWRKVALDPTGHWERSRKARFRRRSDMDAGDADE